MVVVFEFGIKLVDNRMTSTKATRWSWGTAMKNSGFFSSVAIRLRRKPIPGEGSSIPLLKPSNMIAIAGASPRGKSGHVTALIDQVIVFVVLWRFR